MIYGLDETTLKTPWEKSVGEKFIEVAKYLTEKGKTSPVLRYFEDGDISLTWRQNGMDFSVLAWVDADASEEPDTADADDTDTTDDAEENYDTEVDFIVIVNGVVIHQYGWESIERFSPYGFIDEYQNRNWKRDWEEACQEAWNHAIAEGTGTMIIPGEDIDPILAGLDTVDLAVRAERIYEYFLSDDDEDDEDEGKGEVATAVKSEATKAPQNLKEEKTKKRWILDKVKGIASVALCLILLWFVVSLLASPFVDAFKARVDPVFYLEKKAAASAEFDIITVEDLSGKHEMSLEEYKKDRCKGQCIGIVTDPKVCLINIEGTNPETLIWFWEDENVVCDKFPGVRSMN